MAQRDPGAVARERAEIFGLGHVRRRPPARAYAALMTFVLTVLALILVPELADAAPFQVTNPGNGSGLTLEQAIAASNNSPPGPNQITFASTATNDTVTSSQTIRIPVTIDGGSGVTLDFSGVSGDAFDISTSNVVLDNLTMFGASGDGISITGNGNDTISHDAIYGFGGVALLVSSAGNQIVGNRIASGNTAIALRNTINTVSNDTLTYTPPGLAIDNGHSTNSANAPTNRPIITDGTVSSSGTTVDGTLNVEPGASGSIEVYDQSQAGSSVQDSLLGETTFSAGADGNATWHFATNNVVSQGHTLVAFQTNAAATSEMSDPFAPTFPRTCPFLPAVQSVAFHFNAAEGASARYVDALIQAADGHRASDSELAQLGNLLAALTRQQVAKVVDESPESASDEVIGLYQGLLGRNPSSSEVVPWANAAQSAGERSVEASLLASPELYSCAGDTDASFINQVYEDVLRRPADQSALNFFGGQLASGTSRGTVVAEVMGSNESREDVVDNLFVQLLGRHADNAALGFYGAELTNSTEEAVEEQIESSTAFLAHIGTPPAFNAITFRANGLIAFSLLRAANVRLVVFRVLSGGAGDLATAAVPRLRRVGVVGFGHHRKGRVRVPWNHTVNGHRLPRGRYVVVLQATGPRGRILYQSDPHKLQIRR